MFSDARYRGQVVARLRDPIVRGFWEKEFARLPEALQREAAAPIQNKVGQFAANPLIRNMVGQSRSAVNLRRVMDEGKILIANLATGRIGEETSHLLGSLLITQLYLAAMSRVDVPEAERRDFFLYVDEFQHSPPTLSRRFFRKAGRSV